MKINKNTLIICSIVVIAIITCLFVSLQTEKQSNAINKSISEKLIQQRYAEIAQIEKNAKIELKLSEQKYDSIYKLHLTFEERFKKSNTKIKIKVDEIKKLDNSTRSRYVDSVLRFKNIRTR
jgi:nitrate/nitrite-specific signal transduction histidine kinase